MSPNKKKNWLAAMRSGKYHHTRGTLFDGKCHCAMGVLADLSPGLFEKGVTPKGAHFYKGKLSNALSFGIVYQNEREALGISGSQMDQITYLNDGSSNYDKVIEYIRTNL